MNASAASRLCMIFLLLCSLPVFAQANAKPLVSVAREGALFRVYASIVLPVTPCIAYRLLTDYKSLPGYIPGMLQIRAKRISDKRVDIWQEGEVDVLFFRVKLVASLEMEETPERRIVFRQTGGDLASYSGEWNILKTGGGTIVSYNALITLKAEQFIPAFLAKSVLEKEVRKRFEAIAEEASRRGNKDVHECVSSE
ncbi:MAG TPA: SRPBCC family protein [Gallionella sp.]|nr:SRPBCC family protein [Gallionella sp.]